MLNADVHLLLLRPTRVPIAGEGVSEGFQGQVELDGWTWSFHNEDERKKTAEKDEHYSRRQSLLETTKGRAHSWKKKAYEARRDFEKAMKETNFDSDEEREKYMRNSYFKEAADTEQRAAEASSTELKARKKHLQRRRVGGKAGGQRTAREARPQQELRVHLQQARRHRDHAAAELDEGRRRVSRPA